MKKISYTLFAFLSFYWTTVSAEPNQLHDGGNTVGNGGHAIVCDNSPEIRILDYVEAVEKLGLSIDLGNGDAIQKALNVAKRVEVVDPDRGQRYKEKIEKFYSEAKIGDYELQFINDANILFLPAGCKLKQAAIQLTPADNGIKYVIDARIFNQMNDVQKAILILHEVVYQDAIRLKHENSVATRHLVGVISSTSFQTPMQYVDYVNLLRKQNFAQDCLKIRGTRFFIYEPDPILEERDGIHFFPNNQVKSGMVCDYVARYPVYNGVQIEFSGRVSSTYGSVFAFHPNGMIRMGTIDKPTQLITTDNQQKLFELIIRTQDIAFDELGRAFDLDRLEVSACASEFNWKCMAISGPNITLKTEGGGQEYIPIFGGKECVDQLERLEKVVKAGKLSTKDCSFHQCNLKNELIKFYQTREGHRTDKTLSVQPNYNTCLDEAERLNMLEP